MTDPSNLRVLYLQFREPEMIQPELECVYDLSEIPRENYDVIDVLTQAPKPEDLAGHDLLVIGACGSFTASKNDLPHQAETLEVIRFAREKKIPQIGICFGAQLQTLAFGGTLKYQPDNQEVGTFEMTLTTAGQADPVFGCLPEKFMANQGHKDFIDQLPEGAVTLARSELSPVQAWTFPGEPVYASQIHAELTEARFKERLEFYKSLYLDDAEELQQVYDSLLPTPEASKIMQYFLDHVFGRNGPRL